MIDFLLVIGFLVISFVFIFVFIYERWVKAVKVTPKLLSTIFYM